MKNYFKFKESYYGIFKELTDKQAGELIKGVCAYAFEDKPYITKDGYLKGLFLYIKKDIDDSLRDSVNGKKGAEALAKKRAQTKQNGIGLILESLVFAADKQQKDVKAGE